MYKKYNKQVFDCVAKSLVVVTVVAIGAASFLVTPTQQPLLYSTVTQEQLDYEPVPNHSIVDWEHDKNYRAPVEIFKIRPPSITVMRDPSPGIILHVSSEKIAISEADRRCLIRNVFYESGGESYEGKIAVAQVTWNRVRSGAWGKTVCQVVHAPHQFSWTRDTVKRNRPLSGVQVAAVQEAVDDFLNGIRVSKLDYSMHFHATHVRPTWATADARVKRIGGHVFYALK
jgi:hypothetical protein